MLFSSLQACNEDEPTIDNRASNSEILSFTLSEQTGDASIDTVNNSVTIEVAHGTDVTKLSPTISLSSNAIVEPASGTEIDFSNPVVFTVTAENETATDWIVTVTIEELMSPEEHKQNLQNDGLEFVNELERLEASQTTKTIASLISLFGDSSPPGRAISPVIGEILLLSTRRISISDFTDISNFNNDDFTLEDLWAEYLGTYTWDSSIEDWDYVEGGDLITFFFPSTENGTENNSKLSIRDYESIQVNNPIDEEYAGDLPTNLLVDLFVDELKEMEYTLSIDYGSDGIPESLETSLFINPFKLSWYITNTVSEIGSGVVFENETEELLGSNVAVTGDFSDEAISGLDESDDPTDVIGMGSLEFRVMNISFLGEIDFEGLYPKTETILENEGEVGFNYDMAAIDLESTLNEHISIGAFYIETGETIANVEFYTYVEVDEFDSNYKYIELGGTLVFSDGSKVDLEDYLEEGWDEIEASLEELIEALESDFDN